MTTRGDQRRSSHPSVMHHLIYSSRHFLLQRVDMMHHCFMRAYYICCTKHTLRLTISNKWAAN